MAYQERPGSGSLFPNDKQGNDRAPDYKGTLCLSTGEVIRLAAWTKQGARGEFLSVSIDKPREQSAGGGDFRRDVGGGGSAPVARGGWDDPDTEIPFLTSDGIR